MVVSLDIDAPFPSFNLLGPILHWIQPGLKPEPSESTSNTFNLKSTAPFVANYIGPAPPPGSSPHRYIFFLFEQPDAFDGAKYTPPDGQNLGNMSRMRYDLDAWGKEIGLGSLVAVNYFRSHWCQLAYGVFTYLLEVFLCFTCCKEHGSSEGIQL